MTLSCSRNISGSNEFPYFYTFMEPRMDQKSIYLKALLSIILVLLASHSGFSQEWTNSTEAFRISAETKKPVLLIFSGSDWCAPCIRFEKKVLSENAFQVYAKDHLIILKADFPQRKKLSEELRKQNDALAEQYNPSGLFPHLVLLTPDQSNATTLMYSNQTSNEFISEINAHVLQ